MLDDLEAIVSARNIEEVWSHLPPRMADYGFDRVIYGFTRYRMARSFGNPHDLLILSNHESGYIDPFIKGGLYFDAPMVHWAANHVGSCSWHWMRERAEAGAMTPEELRVMEFNRKHGVTAGYTISFMELSSRAKGAVGLSAPSGVSQDDVDEIWAQHGRKIELLWNVAHLKLVNLPYNPGGRALTPRQREALEWVSDGKTTADIATIMGLTSATVEKHLRLAREALEVETTTQAVLKAAVQNQIFLVEP
ncbi:LuxR family transcriptional regulator [Actibacterium sp. MT2.3-13A]|uniref:helix-turn-helix transcriptional regulator n=1 Tax=Actibacterium sp. MT2.3-13A TaxID=2828332 RepID=UPI001BA49A30|nr:LuxR family transcriptional regulator [Actibacterium sp. MT2.3-13A]